jgi:TonB family protein
MSWWQYLLLVNIYLVLFYAFYVLLLRKETFFQLNRVYLVTASLLSFFIPLIQANWVQNLFITQQVKYTIYSSPVLVYHFKPVIEDTHISVGEVLAIFYVCGILFLLTKLIWQLLKLKKVISQPQTTAAYSFFKKIKLDESNADNAVIEAHEQVHAQQWHSADVLLIELVMIINWFNPVVYMYRFAIKHIHEYIADRQAVQAGTNKAEYALLLLSQTFHTPAHQLVNPFFNHSLLKQRIIMLQKNNSQRISLIKYGLSAPLFILMLILSSATINNSKTVTVINKKAARLFTIPAEPTALARAMTPDTVVIMTDPKLKKQNQVIITDVKLNPGQVKVTDVKLNPGQVKVTDVALANNATSKAISLEIKAARDTVKKSKVFASVEQTPEFPGGTPAFGKFLSENIKYPKDARDKGIQGEVLATFIVEVDGSLSDIKIARGIGSGCDEEAVRVLKLSPKWNHAVQNGKAVRVQYTVPINYSLADGDEKKVKKTGAVKNVKMTGTTFSTAVPDTVVKFKGKMGDTDLSALKLDPAKQPLYILDGKELTEGGFKNIDVNTIESIQVLKDASAKSLYGERAKNGVVIVNTKKETPKSIILKPKDTKE